MAQPIYDTITCIRCGHQWTVDLARLGQPKAILYRGDNQKVRVETFRLLCPACGAANMHDIALEERRDA